MVLQFNEAPDYASILERDYQKQNRGFENREAAEQANDRRRIQNAGVPVELLTSLIKFSGTAKKMADGLKAQQEERQLDYYIENMSTWTQAQKDLAIDKYENGIDILTDDYKAKWKIAHKINEEGKFTEALELVENSEYKKGRFGFIQAKAKKAWTDIDNNFTKFAGDIRGLDADGLREKLAAFQSEYWKDFKKYPESLQVKLKEKFNQFEAQKLSEVNQLENQATIKRQDTERLFELQTNLRADDLPDFEKNTLRMIDLLMVEKNSSFTEAVEYLQEDILTLVENGSIPESVARKFEAVTILHKGKKGHPREEILKSHAQTFSRTNWDNRLTAATQKSIAIRKTNEQNYRTNFTDDLEAQENERIKQGGTKFTEDEIVEYYKNNYDPSQGGPLTQQMINEWWTAEEAFDQEHKRVLDQRLKNGLPVSKKEADKFNDINLRTQYSAQAISLNTSVPSAANLKNAKALIKAHSVKHNKLEGSPDPSTNETYVNNTTYGELEYLRIYAEEIQTAPSANAAHLNTMKRIKDNIFEGNYDTPPTPSISAAKQRELTLQSATEAVKLNPQIMETGIIFGTEKILEEVRANPNEIHVFYKQLADRYPGVQADQLQYAQLEIAHKLFGGSKPVKSELLEAYEKLDPGVQFLLSTHPTPEKVMRAKIEAFKDDGEITYDEIEFLLEELTELQQKEYPTPELKQTSMDSILGWDFVTTM
jgi:hypothetical protein